MTVRKSPRDGPAYEPSVLPPAAEAGLPVGILVQRLIDDVADTYLDLLDAIYGEIDVLEDRIDELGRRSRASGSRSSATSSCIDDARSRRRGRQSAGSSTAASTWEDGALFPSEVERLFGDTYDTPVRVTEELDVARDLLAGARDHLSPRSPRARTRSPRSSP